MTNTLADRDQLIGDVIANLGTTMGALADQSTQFTGAVDSLAAALATIANRKQDLRNGLAYADAAAASIGDLLVQGRAPLTKVIPRGGPDRRHRAGRSRVLRPLPRQAPRTPTECSTARGCMATSSASTSAT